MAGILNYCGPELLSEIREAYAQRISLATERGYADPGSRYYWLYEELEYRLRFLRQAQLFIDALPRFITEKAEDDAVGYVVRFVTAFFNPENCGNAQNVDGRHPYFNEENRYYQAFTEALEHLDRNYDLADHPLLFVDLTECVVRAVRLHLQIREREFHAIDRNKFDALMQMREPMPASA